MTPWLPGFLVLTALAAGFSAGQGEPTKKTEEPRKSNSAAALVPKKALNPDETEPSSPRDDVPALPAGAKVWISPEKFKELEDRYQSLRQKFLALERQLKKERLSPSACKLSGRLDGDVAVLRAEISFRAPAPQSIVFLGLKNGYLVDEGQIVNGQIGDAAPHLEAVEDGYIVRVEKEGPQRLSLNLRVPVAARRNIALSAGNERGFDLGLPGAAVTTLAFDLPKGAKDLRWNDSPAAPKSPGHWDLTLGAQKNLAVVWKEPVATPSSAASQNARVNLKVKIEEGRVELTGELVLEDAKNPMRTWQLLLPAQVKVSPAVGSPAFTWQPPTGKSNVHLIQPTEPADKLTLSLQAQYARTLPQQKLPVGPALVQGASTQGTILIQSAPGVLRGQRLQFHSFGEIFQRDPPKALAGVENRAQFQFWNAPFSGKGLSPAKASLELEWKAEKGQVDAVAEHDVKLRENQDGQWVVDVESRFVVQSANSAVDALDLQTPALSFPDLLWLGVQPELGFPAALRWPVALPRRPAFPFSLTAGDDVGPLEVLPADAQRRVRLKLNRPIGNNMVVKAQSKLLGPGDANRFLIELPKLLGVLDRGAKITVWAPPGQELLVGRSNQSEPVPEKYEQSFEQMPANIEVAWRGNRRERLARTVVDLSVREQSLHVRQTLLLPTAVWSGGATNTGQLALRLPTPDFTFSVLNSQRIGQDKTLAWIKLPPENKDLFELHLEYDIALTERNDAAIPLLWPEGASRREAKLRIWTEPGVTPTIVGLGDVWKERPLEEGPNGGAWPALVAAGAGPALPLTIQVATAAGRRLPSLVADRSLIQVRVDDDGTQAYRCRYLVRKFSGTSLDVELPMASAQAHFRIAGKEIGGVLADPLRNRFHVPLAPHLYPQPVLLEIAYNIPAGQADSRRLWQTFLAPPRFEGDVVFGPTRWQAALPAGHTPFVLGATSVDYQWGLSGWLLSPEASVSAADLDAWIGAAEAADPDMTGLTWWRGTVQGQRIYHAPRPLWLALCSGGVLVLGMLVLLAPLPRIALGLIVLVTGVAIGVLGLLNDYLLPVLFMGCQPGLVALAVVVAMQWILLERHRRQLVFMPSFSRTPQGSTVIRQSKLPRDPSTVDAPSVGSGSGKTSGT
jgi:hypothetical protein